MSDRFVERKTYRDNYGDLIEYAEFQNGKLKTWHENGKLWKEEFYKNGTLIRTKEYFKPVVTQVYTAGLGYKVMESYRKESGNHSYPGMFFCDNPRIREGESKKWFNGVLISQKFHKNNILHGIQREWYSDGKHKIDAFFRNGVTDGEYKEWDKEGKMIAHKYYVNGILTDQKFSWEKKYAMINAKRRLYFRRSLPSLDSRMIPDLSKMVCEYVSG